MDGAPSASKTSPGVANDFAPAGNQDAAKASTSSLAPQSPPPSLPASLAAASTGASPPSDMDEDQRSSERQLEEAERRKAERDRTNERATMEARIAAVAKQRDAKTDRMIDRLKKGDEQLANLLSQAADSLSALLPRRHSSAVGIDPGLTNDPNDLDEADADEFEKKAQDWFTGLNEVQTNMRAAVHHLRRSKLPPLTPNASSVSQASGQLGSAERGDSLRLLDQVAQGGSSSRDTSLSTEEESLSVSALRLEEQGWKGLSKALGEIHTQRQVESAGGQASSRSGPGTGSSTPLTRPISPVVDPRAAEADQQMRIQGTAGKILSHLATSDARLLDALLKSGA
ncbi:hypothetical protein K437DRAFT_51346 [Tilletiaria anomala UBC 951]|uniref:Mediator of RNA polymerase II transcription subunit 11 n=1 Tax=Tilletiaria anomala (strain ATCC 24038 / CBS 436.72 / UBC 951) TaxID=1037660 RepID=A0A066WLB5_TILAU|nr:uncharacterized protein K437DRAFT_51346 [Tilletiaria anomala UBC 951]KDN51420.1 hypothetical protein K437DRAFT_51346 [Tilletiaria anomala UBC 951]